jgi:hypothetical protein
MALLGISTSGSTGAALVDGTNHANDAAYGVWKRYLEAGETYLSHLTTDPSDTDAEFISPAIVGDWVNGQKIVVGMEVVLAGADLAGGFQIEGSMDGKNWVRIGSELEADQVHTAGVYLYTADLSDYVLPWYRLSFNDDTHNLTTIKYKFLVSGLGDGTNTSLNGVEIGGDGTTGIGVDPS